MTHRTARRQARSLAVTCLMLSLFGGFLTLSLLAMLLFGGSNEGKYLGLGIQQAIDEGAVVIDYASFNDIMGTTGTERAIGPDTDIARHVTRYGYEPMARRGLGLPAAIAALLTAGLFYVACWLWFAPGLAPGAARAVRSKEPTP